MNAIEYANKLKNLEEQINEERQKSDKKESIFTRAIFLTSGSTGLIIGLLAGFHKNIGISYIVGASLFFCFIGLVIGAVIWIIRADNGDNELINSFKKEFNNVTKNAIEEDLKKRYNVVSVKNEDRLRNFSHYLRRINFDPAVDVELKNGEKYNATLEWNKDKAQVKIAKATKIFELKENNLSEGGAQDSTPFDVIESLSKVDAN